MQPVDICNMALSEMGARVTLNNLNTDATPAAVNCRIWYDRLRRQLLRSAPWGFSRKVVQLTPTGSILNNPPDNQYPQLFNYAYPSDCLKVRYLLPAPPPIPGVASPAPGEPLIWYPWMMPSRNWRFLVSSVGDTSQILANIQQAVGVYNADITNCDLFDELFIGALAAALAEKLILPLSGNIQMKQGFIGIASKAVTDARAADGNEALPSTDHTPDWIAVRGLPGSAAFLGPGGMAEWGMWYCDWNTGGYGD